MDLAIITAKQYRLGMVHAAEWLARKASDAVMADDTALAEELLIAVQRIIDGYEAMTAIYPADLDMAEPKVNVRPDLRVVPDA